MFVESNASNQTMVCNNVNISIFETDIENVAHTQENIDFLLVEQRHDELVHNDSSDIDDEEVDSDVDEEYNNEDDHPCDDNEDDYLFHFLLLIFLHFIYDIIIS